MFGGGGLRFGGIQFVLVPFDTLGYLGSYFSAHMGSSGRVW